MEKLIFCPPPVIALLLIGLGLGLDALIPGLPKLRAPGGGMVLMGSGLFLGLSALASFRVLRTTFIPHGDPAALATCGPYAWTRNPMYLGLCTAMLGLAFYLGHLPLFAVPAAFALIIDRAYIPYEEAKLHRLFGDTYEDYRRRVKRWI
jgi:protein-S-isoprenylcysteine O-methyltransferase Ste14